MLAPWKKSYDQPTPHVKKQRHYFANKCLSSQSYRFSSSHVWMWKLDCKESWVPNNWCFWTVVLEKALERPLDCKEIQPVHPKGNQSWTFIGRTDAEAEAPSALATWCKELTHWKRPWCCERLKAGGEGDDIGWDGWMASPTQRTWVWVSSRSWWWTGKPGILQSMGSQRVRHDCVTELHWRKFMKNKKQSAHNFGGRDSYREIKSWSLFCWSWQSSWGNMKQRWIKHKSKLSRQWHRSCMHVGMIDGPRSRTCYKYACVRRPREGEVVEYEWGRGSWIRRWLETVLQRQNVWFISSLWSLGR